MYRMEMWNECWGVPWIIILLQSIILLHNIYNIQYYYNTDLHKMLLALLMHKRGNHCEMCWQSFFQSTWAVRHLWMNNKKCRRRLQSTYYQFLNEINRMFQPAHFCLPAFFLSEGGRSRSSHFWTSILHSIYDGVKGESRWEKWNLLHKSTA